MNLNPKKVLIALLFQLVGLGVIGQETPLWLRYPAISPDGKTIAFNYKGNIYRVNTEGGVASALTTHPAYDHQACWSPDSKMLVFASDRYGAGDLFSVSAMGGKAERLTFHSGAETPTGFTADGKSVLFTASIQDVATNVYFPSPVIPELYRVAVTGGRVEQVLSTPAIHAVESKDGKTILYEDRKGYENIWRKHHKSSIARDIWAYDTTTKQHRKLSSSKAEDRNPVLASDQQTVYFLSEQTNNTFNVHKLKLDNPSEVTAVSTLEKHPVRFLSIANNNLLCFSWNGEIYTQRDGEAPKKVAIQLFADDNYNAQQHLTLTAGARDMAVSPDGKEVAFVTRGEVYVTSVKYATTKRITNTPEQERSVSFSPDGSSILYASERKGSWNIYQTKRARKEEKDFANATLLTEEVVYENLDEESFQPRYAPNGKEVAFLSNRSALKVIELASKKVRTILDGTQAYSYSDGDQWYEWSPDSKWFVVQHSPTHFTRDNLGLIAADGKESLKTVLITGYNDRTPHWGAHGDMLYWFTDRQGLRSHGSWGAQVDVYALFLTQKAYDKYRLSEEDFSLLPKEKKETDKKEADKKGKKGKKKEDAPEDSTKTKLKKPVDVVIEWENMADRMARLTLYSSDLADAIIDSKGEKMYYLSRVEKGYDLWESDLRKKEVKKLLELKGNGGDMQLSDDEKELFLMSDGKMLKIELAGAKRSDINFSAQFDLDKSAEYAYFFEHAWRQVREKWYDPNLHGVDWDFYKAAYLRFIPHIDNNYDFAEMLSETLGELNGSHTGSGYRYSAANSDQTASLGLLYDWTWLGDGIRVVEVLERGPCQKAESKITTGTVIEKIDGIPLDASQDFYRLLNHKAGKKTLLSLSLNGKHWDEVILPTSLKGEAELLYQRWVKSRSEAVEKLSGGKLGYTHVRGMNSSSFRKVYSEVMGENATKKALIVDTRFNGGGWLHDDLAILLSGKEYVSYWPRNSNGPLKKMGSDPLGRWTKPSCVIVSESNYSDAHAFPFTYKALEIGKLVGMPVPGTMTAVWWESLPDGSLYFGIPQVGARDVNNNYLENSQLEPDIEQALDYERVIQGQDQQLEKAVEHLLQVIK